MAPSNYSRGRAFEYRVKERLLKDGAVYVMRAASSKGVADLLAFWPVEVEPDPDGPYRTQRHPWLVQTKYSINGTAYLPAREKTALLEIAKKCGAKPIFARPGKNNRGVEFIDLSNTAKE